jgi:hypothetical protein
VRTPVGLWRAPLIDVELLTILTVIPGSLGLALLLQLGALKLILRALHP